MKSDLLRLAKIKEKAHKLSVRVERLKRGSLWISFMTKSNIRNLQVVFCNKLINEDYIYAFRSTDVIRNRLFVYSDIYQRN